MSRRSQRATLVARQRRQQELENRSAVGRVAGRHRPAVALDDGADDRQAEAAARGRAGRRARGVGLVEAIEDVRQVLGRDARAGVAYRDADLCRRPVQPRSSRRPPSGVWRTALAARFCSACSRRCSSASSSRSSAHGAHERRCCAPRSDGLVALGDPLEQVVDGHRLDRRARSPPPSSRARSSRSPMIASSLWVSWSTMSR